MDEDSIENIKIIEKKFCVIDKKEHPVIFEFDVAHIGWELDTKGWIVEINGKPRLVMSDHGTPYLTSDETITFLPPDDIIKQDVSILKEMLNSYQYLINATNEAISLLET